MKIIIVGGGETGLTVAKLYENEAEIGLAIKDTLEEVFNNPIAAACFVGSGWPMLAIPLVFFLVRRSATRPLSRANG